MTSLLKELRFGLRMMARSPVVSAVAILSVALAIGAATTAFALFNGFFLKGLPVVAPEELVMVAGTDSTQGPAGRFMPVSRPNYEDFRDRSRSFTGLVNLMPAGATLVPPGGEPEGLAVQLVSGNYFEVLGVKAERGRLFGPAEDAVEGRDRVVVLSHLLWRRSFGADPEVVGRSITLNGQSFTVIGVAEQGFNGTFLGGPTMWAPIALHRTFMPANLRDDFDDRRALFTFSFGRLAPGVSAAAALTELVAVAKTLEEAYPEDNRGRSVTLLPLAQATLPPALRQNLLRAGWLLLGVVTLVLLIACANVANLLMAQASSRRKEIAVRLSLGAPRRRLIRQLLGESALLALAGGILGLLFAEWGRLAIWAARPPFLENMALDTSFDLRVVLFALLVTAATGLLFGLAPALRSTRPGLVDDLKQGSELAVSGARRLSLRNLLVVGQVALSFLALMGSGLFLRSLGNAMAIDPGFETDKLVMVPMNAGALGYEPAEGEGLFDRALERARHLPGVRSAALGNNFLLGGGGFLRTVIVEDRPPEAEGNSILTTTDPIGEAYFETTGIELERGRPFSRLDGPQAPFVAIFNETAAETFWPGEEAVGKRFRFFGEEWELTVVGVARDAKYQSVGEEPQLHVYLPRWQHYSPFMTLYVRSEGAPQPLVTPLREEIRALAPGLPGADPRTMGETLRQSLWPARLWATLLGVLGVLALVLAVAGIYGVTAYSVGQSQHEIGIRMALGARPRAVVGLFLRRGMVLVAVGLAVGACGVLVGNRSMEALLYGLEPTDLPTLVATALLLSVIAFVANLLPARRATRVDPVVALKGEA